MHYHDIEKDNMLNGEGLRVVLWVSGCSHNCTGCHNPITHDASGGLIFDDKAKEELFRALAEDYINGLTLSGGDPLFLDNRKEITDLAKEIRGEFPSKTIWLYTGFSFEEVRDLEIMNFVNIVVDGKFILEQKDIKLHYRGSKNQRIIDVKKSLDSGIISLVCI